MKFSFLLVRPCPVSAEKELFSVGASLLVTRWEFSKIISLPLCIFRVQSDFFAQKFLQGLNPHKLCSINETNLKRNSTLQL